MRALCGPWIGLEAARVLVPAATEQAVPDVVFEPALLAASEILFGLSGGLWPGECERSIEVAGACPCGTLLTSDVRGSDSPYWWRVGGGDLIVGGGTCRHELVLPDGPVVSVEEIRVDGVALDPTDYELIGGSGVRRTDGSAWSSRRLEVDYTTGGLPGEAGLQAAAVFGHQLALARVGSSACTLPQRVQTITRAGVTMALLDPQLYLENGRTGVFVVDVWLASLRAPQTGARVLSPDDPTLLTRRIP